MTRPNRKPHTRFFQAVAVWLVLFFGGTIVAPCAHASTVTVSPAAEAAAGVDAVPEKFAGVAPQVPHNVACACVDCPGLHGGKCCCAAAPTPGDGYALRAVCDTAPDAQSPLSPLPPVVLPQVASIAAPVFASAACVTAPPAPHRLFALDAPLPPDAPPRLS